MIYLLAAFYKHFSVKFENKLIKILITVGELLNKREKKIFMKPLVTLFVLFETQVSSRYTKEKV